MKIRYNLLLIIIIAMVSCKTIQPVLHERKQTTTIIEKLVDTSIHTGTDSLLSAFQYKIDSGQISIKPLWKFGSSVLDNILRIDTTNKMIYINTIKHDTLIKIQYKNIHRTDTIYEKIVEQVITNKLNAFQKFMYNSGWGLWVLILIIIVYIILKITKKIPI